MGGVAPIVQTRRRAELTRKSPAFPRFNFFPGPPITLV